jgi:hypothetical protein
MGQLKQYGGVSAQNAVPSVPAELRKIVKKAQEEVGMREACGQSESSAAAFKRLRKQARDAEKAAEREKAAKKAAAKRERQRQADRELALEALRNIAAESRCFAGHGSADRIAAAKLLLEWA